MISKSETNHSDIVKRICIFIVLAFAISQIPVILYMRMYGDLSSPVYQMIGVFTMAGPALASVLTRCITKEGFSNMYLRVNLKNNGKYYLLAILFPIVSCAANGILLALLYGRFLSADGLKEMSPVVYFSVFFYTIANAVALFFYAMGEELGWRGYMTPKLEEVMGTPAALIVSGIIWGVWHSPDIVLCGSNFGTKHPVLGILAMCVMCFGMGSVFTFLTKKTNSVYPAAIAHSINNNISGIILILFVDESIVKEHQFEMGLIGLIPLWLLGTIAYVILVKDV